MPRAPHGSIMSARTRVDQIAQKLGVSRQAAQRLVSLAVAEGLVKVRIDHPIAACLELAERLKARFGLAIARSSSADPGCSGRARRHRARRGLRDGALADAGRAAGHGDRHRPLAAGLGRADAAYRLSAASRRLADRLDPARRLAPRITA